MAGMRQITNLKEFMLCARDLRQDFSGIAGNIHGTFLPVQIRHNQIINSRIQLTIGFNKLPGIADARNLEFFKIIRIILELHKTGAVNAVHGLGADLRVKRLILLNCSCQFSRIADFGAGNMRQANRLALLREKVFIIDRGVLRGADCSGNQLDIIFLEFFPLSFYKMRMLAAEQQIHLMLNALFQQPCCRLANRRLALKMVCIHLQFRAAKAMRCNDLNGV